MLLQKVIWRFCKAINKVQLFPARKIKRYKMPYVRIAYRYNFQTVIAMVHEQKKSRGSVAAIYRD